jgi:hypothetical protein
MNVNVEKLQKRLDPSSIGEKLSASVVNTLKRQSRRQGCQLYLKNTD